MNTPTASARKAWTRWWPGEAVLVRRYELPVGHALAAPAAGHPTDWLELGADDALRPTSQRKDTVIADVDRVFDPHAPATQNRSSTYFHGGCAVSLTICSDLRLWWCVILGLN